VTGTAAPLLEVRDLHAGYGALDVLRGVDLTVGAGEVVAVLGPNGAGKSTLLRAISRFDAAVRSGTMRFDGNDLLRCTTERTAAAGLPERSRRTPAVHRAER
jgi:branched-chain amino acid transport system ATP-binding protein